MGFIATLAYLAVLVLRPQELHPEWAQYRIMDVLGGVAILSTAVSLTIERRPHPVWQQASAAMIFLFWSALSVATAVRWLGGATERLVELSIPIFTFVVIALNVTTRRRVGVCVAVVVVSLMSVLWQATQAYYSEAEQSPFFIKVVARASLDALMDTPEESGAPGDGDGQPTDLVYVKRLRALGFLNDPNDFAQALVAVIPLVFLAWRRVRPFVSFFLVIVPVSVLIWGIVLTRSRGGLLALLALLPLARLVRMPARRRRTAMATLAIVAAPGITLLFRYALSDESAMGRIEAWSAGLQMLKSSPVWGVGSGFFMDHHPRVAHNSFVQCFAETGLVGYFLWLSLVVLSLGVMSRLAETSQDAGWVPWARAAQLSLLGFLVGAMFLSRTTSPLLFLLTGLTAAIASAARAAGQDVGPHRSWPVHVLGLEVFSILTAWLTARAAW